MQKKNKPTATEYAVSLLARTDYSERRLREKVRQKGYGLTAVEEAMDFLTDRGYIDDRRTIETVWFSLYEGEEYSLRQIHHKLVERGYSESLVTETINAVDMDERIEREHRTALKLARQKAAAAERHKVFSRPGPMAKDDEAAVNESPPPSQRFRDWRPIAAFLYHRGFSDAVSRQAAKEALEILND